MFVSEDSERIIETKDSAGVCILKFPLLTTNYPSEKKKFIEFDAVQCATKDKKNGNRQLCHFGKYGSCRIVKS